MYVKRLQRLIGKIEAIAYSYVSQLIQRLELLRLPGPPITELVTNAMLDIANIGNKF